ncbi:glucokinase [Rarobacter faecitabidus]|uniref:Glucokinase n=1 Tax=Rarobacter faecitabidus TaxID=13243 RepID=A0A542ZPB4_RARFA|nr:ROK family protein [Rarobacter faecitabidus]TQL62079.1 glucokinase [Rarobacter faecitabidus]
MATHVIGIDLGGTNLRAGLFEGKSLVRSETIPSRLRPGTSRDAKALADIVEQLIRKLVAGSSWAPTGIAAIGVVASGPIDAASGVILNDFTLPDWSGVPWLGELGDRFGVPTPIENDAMGALIGEVGAGAARGADVAAMVTLGTGIGVAVHSSSTGPMRGTRGCHPEGGHVPIGLPPAGIQSVPDCYCGIRGCFESVASGEALHSLWTSPAGEIDWLGYGRAVLRGLQFVARAFGPDLIVIGGGVADRFDQFCDPVYEWFGGGPRHDWPMADEMGVPGGTRIVRAALDEPGLHGAAAIAYQASTAR